MKKRGLGRGLDALLSSVAPPANEDSGESLRELALDALVAGRHQPRRDFDATALKELADSIKAQGVVQPIVVRPVGGDRYEIVAGERRWRAAKLAGVATIPALIRALDDRGAMTVALVENIQRADLNPLEESGHLRKLIDECGLTHEQCAKAVGKDRSSITNLLRLSELEADVQQRVRERQLSLGHAKVLLGVSGARQSALAKMVVDQQLSVRATEALVQGQAPAAKAKPARHTASKLEHDLAARIGLPVKLKQNDKGRGKLTVSFRSKDELDQLIGRLG
jgi:ParB family chromosome partitioning protein